jgi:hypothetical protein
MVVGRYSPSLSATRCRWPELTTPVSMMLDRSPVRSLRPLHVHGLLATAATGVAVNLRGHHRDSRQRSARSPRWGSGCAMRLSARPACWSPGCRRSAWRFHRAESTTSTHHEPFMIHCLAASICPAGKCRAGQPLGGPSRSAECRGRRLWGWDRLTSCWLLCGVRALAAAEAAHHLHTFSRESPSDTG